MGKVELRFEVDEDLVKAAVERGVDPNRAAEAGLRQAVAVPLPVRDDAEARAEQWREENRDALAARRARIAQYGVFGEDLRRW